MKYFINAFAPTEDYIKDKMELLKELEKNFMNHYNDGIIYGELMRQNVKLSRDEKIDVNTLLIELEYNEDSLNTIKMLLQRVAEENYKLGAERQKEALISNLCKYVERL